VAIDRHVGGLGPIRREFAMAAGEMAKTEFTSFLHIGRSSAATYLQRSR
jgi:hypothetical protein